MAINNHRRVATQWCTCCKSPTEWRDERGHLVGSIGLFYEGKAFCTTSCKQTFYCEDYGLCPWDFGWSCKDACPRLKHCNHDGPKPDKIF